jgi:hypothetical protein
MPPVLDLVLIELLLIAFIGSAILTVDRIAANPYALVAISVSTITAVVWFAAYGV